MARLPSSRSTSSANKVPAGKPETGGRSRTVIKNIWPQVDCGRLAAKGLVGEPLPVGADIFADGHDVLSARILSRDARSKAWTITAMRAVGNDAWEGVVTPLQNGYFWFRIQAWVCPLKTWFRDYELKRKAGVDLSAERLIGTGLLEAHAAHCPREERKRIGEWVQRLQAGESDPSDIGEEEVERWSGYPAKDTLSSSAVFPVFADRSRAGFGAWYELFPRSCASEPGRHGTFRDVAERLPELAAAGFDVLYLPPIHPIGRTNRKGRNNVLSAGPDDPGSPWAIGNASGGHTAIHPDLGNLSDFKSLLQTARRHQIEVALDIAFQCSPDHPYVKSNPEWFRWRPDGTIQFAENPPKKYEDILRCPRCGTIFRCVKI